MKEIVRSEFLLLKIKKYMNENTFCNLCLAMFSNLPRNYREDPRKIFQLIQQPISKIIYQFNHIDSGVVNLNWKIYIYDDIHTEYKYYCSGSVNNLSKYKLVNNVLVMLSHRGNRSNGTRYAFMPNRFCNYRLYLKDYDDMKNYRQFLVDLTKFYGIRSIQKDPLKSSRAKSIY